MIYLIYFVWCELLHYNIEQQNERKKKLRNDTKHKSKFPLQASKKDEP